ncbi:E3 ubiquitin-protein ligase RGLG1-like [Xenia sp. Carnegie-2017]|uniref:E3 ubiquitin-protein ligase RGLG1-like n=1 Tax=Xenia sp. Carnegie-2017 TaxID=2897299 RepID=UPI001F04B9DA|nr:E3 ubiquitin-protein ligase RGLG1-like [Xenia sp. Carnegie-2017]
MDGLLYILMICLFMLFIWITYIIYNVIYFPMKAFYLIPRKIRDWSLLLKFGVTNRSNTFVQIDDRFNSLDEVKKAMRVNGLTKCQLIIGIDFTASNEWQGRKTFGGRSLHHITIEPKSKRISKWNPYQRVIRAIGDGLQEFDEDNLIPAFGFGDERSKDHGVFPLMDDPLPCKGIDEVLERYTRTVGSVSLSGPTSFAPIIHKAIAIVEMTQEYHILLIIADGRVENMQDLETRNAIVDASNFPLSIVLVGVGDGPWDMMHEYDDKLPLRRFDNFQFVEFVEKKASRFSREFDDEFALRALMEIPDQYKAIRSLDMLKTNDNSNIKMNHYESRRKDSRESRHPELIVTHRRSHDGILETDL